MRPRPKPRKAFDENEKRERSVETYTKLRILDKITGWSYEVKKWLSTVVAHVNALIDIAEQHGAMQLIYNPMEPLQPLRIVYSYFNFRTKSRSSKCWYHSTDCYAT